ncbi:hypothetical protein [Tabrizicola aquatica]|uniref:hypothetical protein n=1 Tax=Tabrizicola aquatica TaxID=909926 RepID=UPI000CD23D0A|nr:hypothetical protein [Tabrizicola aquatica]
MVVQAAAPVYVGGAALVAGALWLMTPAGQRASQSLGEAMVAGSSQAVDNIRNLFADETEAPAVPGTQEGTRTEERRCDGPHRGRLQVQGYRPPHDPVPVELSWPWNRSCIPPLRPEGLVALSGDLLPRTRAISFTSAGHRGPAFSKMSQHIQSAPPTGFLAGHRMGWGIHPATGLAVPNLRAGPAAPRVDLEVHAGRAFGVR